MFSRILLAFIILSLGALNRVQAATFAWNRTAAGTYSWITTTHWTPTGTPNAIGDVANLNNNISGNQVVNLDQAITLGTLNIGDSDGSHTFTLAAGTGGSLVMDVASGSAAIDKAAGANANDTISTGIQINDALVITNASTGTLTFSGVISDGAGTYGITKSGTGTVVFSGANTYDGVTTLSNGTLALGNVNALQNSTLDTTTLSGSKAVTFTVTGTNTYNLGGLAGADALALGANTVSVGSNNQSTSYTGVISGTGGLTKVGTGTLTLAGTNTFTGKTIINNGKLSLSNENNLGANPGASTADQLTLNGGTLLSTASFTINDGNRGVTLGTSGGTFETDTGTTLTLSRAIAGTGNLTKTGNGILLLTTSSSYTGKTIINAGKVSIDNESRLGNNPGAFTADQLTLDGGTLLITNNFSINDTNRGITLGAAGGTIEVTGGTVSIASTNIITGSGALTKTGSSTLSLAAANTHSGITTVSNGTLALANVDALQNSTLDTGASGGQSVTFTVSGTNTYDIGGLQGADALAITDDSISVGANNQSTSYTGILSSSGGGLTKVGTGTLTLTGTNTHTGATTVTAGVLNIQNASALGTTATGTSVTGGAALEIQGGITVGAEALTLNGTGISSGGALRNISGNNTYGGLVTLGSAARINSDTVGTTLTLSNVGTITGATFGLTVGGVGNTSITSIIGTTTGTLTKDGTGTLTLSGTNTYSGVTTLSNGTLALGNVNALQNSTLDTTTASGTKAVTFTVAGTNTYNVGGLAGADDVAIGANTLSIGANNQSNSYTGAVSGTGAVSKTGSGTQTFAGTNTYTGTTTISAGTLQLGNGTTDGVISNSSNITNNAALNYNTVGTQSYSGVISGSGTVAKTGAGTQTLTGNNTYSGGTTISGGTLVAGSRGLGSGNVNVAAYSILSVSQSGSVGLAGQYFNITPANVSGSDPSFASLGLLQSSLATTAPAQVVNTTTLNFGSGGAGFPSPYSGGSSTNFESFYSGKINIGTAGVYTFNTSSDDGSMLFIDGVAVVNNNFHQAITTRTGAVTLTAGYHDIVVGFYQANGVYGLNAQISGPGNTTMVDLNTGNSNAQITPDLVIGSLSGAGGVVLATGNLITGQDNTSTTFSGGILGIGGVNKWGTGTQTFSGTNTYTGTTTISAGTLQLGDGTTDGVISNSSNITNNAALIYNTIGTQSYTGVISGSGTVTKNGVGEQILTGANSYTGVTTVNAGVLNIQHATALGTTAAGTSVTGGAALEIEGGITVGAEALTLNGTGISNGGALRNISGNNTYGGLVTLGSATRINSDTAGTTLTLSNTGTITGATFGLTVGGVGNTSIAGIIGTTSGTLTKDGTGTLTLSGANTFTGATTVNGGTLTLNYATQNNSKLADASALTLGGGTLEMSGGSHTEVVSSTTISSGVNTVTRSSGSSVLRMNAITRNAGASINFSASGIADTDTGNTNGILGAWATINGSDWAMNSTGGADGSITAYTAYTDVTRRSSGTKVIANTAANNVRIIEGTGTLGNITLAAATTTINTLTQSASGGTSAATIAPAGQTLRLGAVGGILMASGTGGLTIGTSVNDGFLTAGGAANTAGEIMIQQYSGNSLTVNSRIANNGTGVVRVTQSGTGTTVLTGTNTYTGSTTVNGGTLSLSSDANLGAVPGSVTADMVVINGGTLASTANFTLDANRGLTVSSGGGTINTSPGTTLTYNGLVTGHGTLNKDGTGTFITGGNTFNSHTGAVNINAGTFEVAKTAYVGSIDNNAAVTIATGATLKFNGALTYTQETIGSLSGNGTVDNVGLDNVNFLVGDNGTDTTFSGVIQNTGTKVLNLDKRGTGILKLTGTNAYTGSTTVSAGTLQIDGVITSAVTVNARATLSGTGSVSKAITINGLGALRPGNKTPTGSGLGTFTLSGSGADGNLTVATTGTLGLQLGSNGIAFAGQGTNIYTSPGILNSGYVNAANIQANANDRILVGGTLSLTGGSIIDVTLDGYTPALGDAFDLLDWATLSMGTFAVGPGTNIRTGADNALYDLKLPDLTSLGYNWDTSLFSSNGVIVVVPEPSRIILLMAGLAACLLRRRRAHFWVG